MMDEQKQRGLQRLQEEAELEYRKQRRDYEDTEETLFYYKEKTNRVFKETTKTVLNVTKVAVQSVTKDIENHLKGDWGKKAQETFSTVSEKLDQI